MSADNWTTCPNCLRSITKELEEKERKTKNSYGDIPQKEFFGLLEDIKTLEYKLEKEDATLREDYEIYMQYGGKLYIKYSCYCHVCKWQFEHKESIEAINVSL